MKKEDRIEVSFGHKKEHYGPVSELPKAKLSKVDTAEGKKKQVLEDITKEAVTKEKIADEQAH